MAEIIANLGLRFRPSSQTDLEAHAEALKLLSQDVRDIPPQYLDAAAKRWAQESRFMPKAAELIDLARQIAKRDTAGSDAALLHLEAHRDRLNAMRLDWRWAIVGDAPTRRVERVH